MPVLKSEHLPLSSKLAGCIAVLELIGVLCSIALAEAELVPLAITAPIFVPAYYAISLWFIVIGFRRKIRFVPVWIVLFFFAPPSILLYWFFNREKSFNLKTELPREA